MKAVSNECFSAKLLSAQNALRGLALLLTKNEEDAKDLVQETLYRSLSNYEKYDERDNLKAWLSTIMRNIFINNARHKQLGVEMAYDDAVLACRAVTTTADTPDIDISVLEIRRGIDRLPAKYRGPLLMRIESFSYEEISRKCDIPIGTVKSRIFAAREMLRRMLSGYGL